jgi:hypothetical protein
MSRFARSGHGSTLAPSFRMNPKVIAIPIVAAGVALAMVKLASLRRAPHLTPAHAPRPRVSAAHGAPDTSDGRLASTPGVLSQGPGSTTVLPIAFWDAASEQIEDDEAPITPRVKDARDTYDSIAPEDLGVEWLSRATEAFDVGEGSEDDPAEIAADSRSMISEATRFAATSASDSAQSALLGEPESERFDERGMDAAARDDREPRSG